MPYKRKYQQGDLITSLDELYAQEFVYWWGKITPHGWVSSWQIRMAHHAIERGIIRYAVKIEGDV